MSRQSNESCYKNQISLEMYIRLRAIVRRCETGLRN